MVGSTVERAKLPIAVALMTSDSPRASATDGATVFACGVTATVTADGTIPKVRCSVTFNDPGELAAATRMPPGDVVRETPR